MPLNQDPAKAAFDAEFLTPKGVESSVFDAAGFSPLKVDFASGASSGNPAASAFDAAGFTSKAAPENDEGLAARFAADPNKEFSPEELRRIRVQREKPMTAAQIAEVPSNVVSGLADTWTRAHEAAKPFEDAVHKTYETQGYWPALKQQLSQYPTAFATLLEGLLRNESAIGTPIKHGVGATVQNATLAATQPGDADASRPAVLPAVGKSISNRYGFHSLGDVLRLGFPSPTRVLQDVAAARNPEAEQGAWLQREREKFNEAQLMARQPAVPGAVPEIAEATAYASPGVMGPVAKGAALINKVEHLATTAKVGRLARISEQATARATALTEEMEALTKAGRTPEEIAAAVERQKAAEKFARSADERLRAAAAPLIENPAKAGEEFSRIAAGTKPGTIAPLAAVGKGVQKVAQTGEHVVDTVLEKIEPSLDVFHSGKGTLNTLGLGALAHYVIPSHILELGGRGLAAMTSARFGTKLVSRYGELLQKLGMADWKSSVPVWRQLAKDPDAPAWLKTAISSGEGMNPRALAASATEKGARGVAATVQDALHGATVAAGATALDSDSTDEEKAAFVAQGAAGGAIGGRIMSGFTSKHAAKAAMFHDVLRTADQAIKSGANPISVMRTAPSTLFYANALKHLFQGALPGGRSLDVQLLDGQQYAALGTKGVAFYQPETGKAFVNLDAPDTSGRLLHETLGHALWESAVANQPEIAQRIREALIAAGTTPAAAELQYTLKLHPRMSGEDDATYQQRISQYVAGERAKYPNDPDLWILGEIHAEAAARALGGDNILDLSSPVFWDRLGDKTISSPARSFFSGEVLKAVDSLHELPERQLQELGAFRPGVDQQVEQKVPINLDTFGKHPGAPVHELAPGIVGTDFVQQTPDGRVIPRPPSQVKKIIVERQHEVNVAVPPDAKPAEANDADAAVKLRRTPAGRNERSGTVIGDWLEKARSFGNHTKKFAKDIEKAIKDGTTLAGWYQAVGKGPEWKASVARTGGSLTAEHMDFIPYGFLVDSKGNLLVRNYSLNAFERKAREWSAREGDLSLGLWTGDIGAFRNDVKTYLKNHAEGKPGADVIGDRKRDIINVFLTGSANRAMEAKNPLREHLKGNDRKGIVRSFRLDRIETLEPSTIEGFNRPEYPKQLENFSPGLAREGFIGHGKVIDAGEGHDEWIRNKFPKMKRTVDGRYIHGDTIYDSDDEVAASAGYTRLVKTNRGIEVEGNRKYGTWEYLPRKDREALEDYAEKNGLKVIFDDEQVYPSMENFSPAATMDTARAFAEMSPEDLLVHAKNFNNINIELGRKATPQDVAELQQLKARAVARLTEAAARAGTGDAKALDDYAILSTLPQFFNEALAESQKPKEAHVIDQFGKGLPESLNRPGWSIVTGTQEAQGPWNSPQNIAANAAMEKALTEAGIPFAVVRGDYKGVDQGPNYLIAADRAKALELGKKFNQESVLTNEGLVYQDGSVTPSTGQHLTGDAAKAQEFHSVLPDGTAFSMGLDFGKKIQPKFSPPVDENFKKWFGDSKVVNPDGTPRVVYHGTDRNFSRFSLNKATQGIIWVASDRSTIEKGEAGAQGRGKVMELYASIKNPAGWKEYERLGLGELKRDGYDGVILPTGDGHFNAFVFDPRQVKSATKNDGAFDATNPNIRHSPDTDVHLFRGNANHQENKSGSPFFHEDPEFARQFTQSGRSHEMSEIKVPKAVIFRDDPLPYGGDPDEIRASVAKAQKAGSFQAVYTDEGTAGKPSVFVFDRQLLRQAKPYSGELFSPPTMEEWNTVQKKSSMQREEDRRFARIPKTAKKSGTGWILPDGSYAGATGSANVQNSGDFHIGWLQQNAKKYGLPKTDDPRLAALNKGFVRVRMENNGDLHIELNRRFWKAGVKDTVKEILKDAGAWGLQVNFLSPSGKVAGSFYEKPNDLSFSPSVDWEAADPYRYNGKSMKLDSEWVSGFVTKDGDVITNLKNPRYHHPDLLDTNDWLLKEAGIPESDRQEAIDESFPGGGTLDQLAGHGIYSFVIESHGPVKWWTSPGEKEKPLVQKIWSLRDKLMRERGVQDPPDAQFSPDAQGDFFEGYKNANEKTVRAMSAPELRREFPESVIPNDRGGKPTPLQYDFENAPLVRGQKDKVARYAEALAREAIKWQNHPAFKSGASWYSEFVPMLQNAFGDHAQMFAELLAATSPRTNPTVNFGYASKAFEGWMRGEYDTQIKKFGEGLEKMDNGKLRQWYLRNVPKDQRPATITPAAMLGAWVAMNDLVPTQWDRADNRKFGMHGERVLRVLARRWMDTNEGPKTAQFVANLTGANQGATVDVWAARTLRRLGYDVGGQRWRILPENETGVSDNDFHFGQKVFADAAARLGMDPDELQGAMWFAEKQHWDDKGWARMDMGDFRHEMKKFTQKRKLEAMQGLLMRDKAAVANKDVAPQTAKLFNIGEKSLDEKLDTRQYSPMFDLDTIVGMNSKAASATRAKTETETSRHASFAASRGGVVLHSAKQRATVFLKGAQAKKFLDNWNAGNDQTKRDHLVESYF